MVTIVTDSSACLRAPISGSARSRLRVVPIVIHLADRDVRGDDPLAARFVYGALARGEPVKSSAPSVLEYLAAIDEAGDGAVVVTPAAEFTTMSNNAVLAAELTDAPVRVVDCRTAAAAQGLVVLAGVEIASLGGGLDDVATAIAEASRHAHLVATMPTLEHIRRSGRVSPLGLPGGDPAAAHPVFRLRDGLVEHLATCRQEDWIETMRREIEREGWRPGSRAAVFRAAAHDRAEALRHSLGIDEPSLEFSPSMGIHTGPGVVGVAWLADSP